MGLKVNITIPWTYGSPNIGLDANNYFNFYLGTQGHTYDSADTEAGIFYYSQKGWVIFLNMCAWNAPGPYVWEEEAVNVTPGSTHTMELRNNGDYSASFYWDGVLKWRRTMPLEPSKRMPTTGGWFKMCAGKVEDSGQMFYQGGYYSNPQLRLSNGTYSNWTASSWGYAPDNSGDIADFIISKQFPVSTDLR
jgi:hypothetical protein